MNEAVYVTQEGLEKIKAELAERKEVRRPEIADRPAKGDCDGRLEGKRRLSRCERGSSI